MRSQASWVSSIHKEDNQEPLSNIIMEQIYAGSHREPEIGILLVDDNPTFLRIAAEFLKRQAALQVVGTAGGGQEALTLAAVLQPGVIVIDLDMPGMSGLEAIRRLRTALPHARIIALTLLDSSVFKQIAFTAGANGYVPKSSLVTDLLPAIHGRNTE